MTPELTSREKTVLALLSEGRSRMEIARELGWDLPAVHNAVNRAKSKLGIGAAPVGRPRIKPRLDYEMSPVDTSGERCRCGLRKPCNQCLPSIQELAVKRDGSRMP